METSSEPPAPTLDLSAARRSDPTVLVLKSDPIVKVDPVQTLYKPCTAQFSSPWRALRHKTYFGGLQCGPTILRKLSVGPRVQLPSATWRPGRPHTSSHKLRA
eukprot:1104698-Prorocentrum_minimum.AAC.3